MKTVPDWLPAFGVRSMSSASTSATSPPLRSSSAASTCASSPPLHGSIFESSSPDCSFVAQPDFDDESDCPAQDAKPQCPPGALDKSSWLQVRKVFVGGIPQSIDQNGLYQMFSKVGKVKKAWLQLFHNDRGSPIPTTKKHRGFGFVIFYEKQTIDKLLDNESSRFVSFGSDLKLEVKRSFGKVSAPSADEAPSTGNSKKPEQLLASPVSQIWQSSSCTPSAASPAYQASRNGSWMPSSVSPSPQTCQNDLWAASQSCQSLPSQRPLVIAFPCVPPFPSAGSQIVQQPLGYRHTQTLAASHTGTLASEPGVAQQSQYQFLPKAFLQGILGQRPIGSQELTQALLEAMPDHYED